MTSQPGKETIAILILPYISGNNGSQAMKFGQLIEYSKRNIFLEKHTQNVVEKPFTEKSKLSVSLN